MVYCTIVAVDLEAVKLVKEWGFYPSAILYSHLQPRLQNSKVLSKSTVAEEWN